MTAEAEQAPAPDRPLTFIPETSLMVSPCLSLRCTSHRPPVGTLEQQRYYGLPFTPVHYATWLRQWAVTREANPTAQSTAGGYVFGFALVLIAAGLLAAGSGSSGSVDGQQVVVGLVVGVIGLAVIGWTYQLTLAVNDPTRFHQNAQQRLTASAYEHADHWQFGHAARASDQAAWHAQQAAAHQMHEQHQRNQQNEYWVRVSSQSIAEQWTAADGLWWSLTEQYSQSTGGRVPAHLAPVPRYDDVVTRISSGSVS